MHTTAKRRPGRPSRRGRNGTPVRRSTGTRNQSPAVGLGALSSAAALTRTRSALGESAVLVADDDGDEAGKGAEDADEGEATGAEVEQEQDED